jgi:hypothetical protein
MFPPMSMLRTESQVLDTIILGITVYVMHNLLHPQPSSKVLLHHLSVF